MPKSGVDIFAHSAAFMSFVNEADKVIPITVAGAVNALKAAYAEPSVKRFVLTSSSAAAVGLLDNGITVTEDSWNVKAVERAWSGPPYEQERPVIVYEASKTESEQAIWKFHKENRSKRPDLVVNAGMVQRMTPKCEFLSLTMNTTSPAQLYRWAYG